MLSLVSSDGNQMWKKEEMRRDKEKGQTGTGREESRKKTWDGEEDRDGGVWEKEKVVTSHWKKNILRKVIPKDQKCLY